MDDALATVDIDAFHALALQHDVLPIVAERLAGPDVPAGLRERAIRDATHAAVVDLAREVELRRFLSEISAICVAPILMKGSHLAYSHYARSDLRSRADSDILIPAATRSIVHDLLTRGLGYTVSNKVSGEVVLTQKTYLRHKNGALLHALDVHWKVASPPVFANVLSYEELAGSAVPLPRLAPSARGPSDVHALLLACIHRVAHHDNDLNLKWLYDIHLLASSLNEAGWDAFSRFAVDRRVASVCGHGLRRSQQCFGTPLPEWVWTDSCFADLNDREVSAAYLRPRKQIAIVWDDLRILTSWRERLRLLRDHAFPSPEYMRQIYAPRSAAPLPLLYALRIVRGAGKWLSLTH